MYDQFVAMVAPGGTWTPARFAQLADGRAYTGRQALQLGLIDAIGGEQDAQAWLAQAKGVSGRLPVHDVSTEGLASPGVFRRAWRNARRTPGKA